MNYKYIIKKILPPVFLELFSKKYPNYIWDGVYHHRQDVPTHNDTYDDERRVQYLVDDAKFAFCSAKEKIFKGFDRHIALGMLTSVLYPIKNGVHILDFGGGAGTGFVQLIATLKDNVNIKYDVIDFDKTCIAGRKLFENDKRIEFHVSLQKGHNDIDIVYMCSVLPYINDYKALIAELASLNAKYILLGYLAAGDFPTYASKQLNLSGQVLGYWFINIDEIINLVESFGYTCLYKCRNGKEFDQSNFPEAFRIGQMCDILFKK